MQKQNKLINCALMFVNVVTTWVSQLRLLFATALLGAQLFTSMAADLSRKTVEVYDTGGIGLKAWTDTCTGSYVNKPDGTRGLVVSSSQLCGGYNRWQIRWPGDATDRWSAEDWLRVVPCDLAIHGAVTITPMSVVQGGRITVSCIITNVGQGNAPASGTTISVYRAITYDLITQVDYIETVELAPGVSTSLSYDVTLPNNIPTGTYLVQVDVDHFNMIGQTYYANDAKNSETFSVTPSQYTVTAGAGDGGTISPNGSSLVAANSSITFTADPDVSNTVNQWLVDGVLRQTGGTTFTVNPVTANTSVTVTFKLKTYTLSISTSNGSVIKVPDQAEYSVGTEVILTPVANARYVFSSWSGDYSGAGQPLRIIIDANKSVTAMFVSSPTPVTMGYSIGGPIPILNPMTIPIPALDSAYVTTVQMCLDNSRWFDYATFLGSVSAQMCSIPQYPGTTVGICRLEISLAVNEPAFLRFPIKEVLDPYAANISAIMDHDPALNAFLTYRSEQGTDKYKVFSSQSPDLIGFKKDKDGSPFDLKFNYDDGTANKKVILWYDNHTGYDYPANTNTEIVAAASGYIDKTASRSQNKWNGLCIVHDNGYSTWYLHLSRWVPNITLDDDGTTIRVVEGETIGWAGNTGVPGATGNEFVHLHLSVHKGQGNRVDPYGYFPRQEGPPKSPVLWKVHP